MNDIVRYARMILMAQQHLVENLAAHVKRAELHAAIERQNLERRAGRSDIPS